MGKIKNFYHDKIESSMRDNKIYVELPIIDFVPQSSIIDLKLDAMTDAIKIIKDINPDFNENLHTFEYEFICKVILKPIHDTPPCCTSCSCEKH